MSDQGKPTYTEIYERLNALGGRRNDVCKSLDVRSFKAWMIIQDIRDIESFDDLFISATPEARDTIFNLIRNNVR